MRDSFSVRTGNFSNSKQFPTFSLSLLVSPYLVIICKCSLVVTSGKVKTFSLPAGVLPGAVFAQHYNRKFLNQ